MPVAPASLCYFFCVSVGLLLALDMMMLSSAELETLLERQWIFAIMPLPPWVAGNHALIAACVTHLLIKLPESLAILQPLILAGFGLFLLFIWSFVILSIRYSLRVRWSELMPAVWGFMGVCTCTETVALS